MSEIALITLTQEYKDICDIFLQQSQDIDATALALGVESPLVVEVVNTPKAAAYIQMKLNGRGFRSSSKFFDRMDQILEAKFDEIAEADITSSKDIVEIMKLYHDMKMKEEQAALKRIELEIRAKAPTKITNTQVNMGNDALQGLPGVLKSILEG